MVQHTVHFVESSPEDNPVIFEIMPLPDEEFLRVFYNVIERNPRNELGTAEAEVSPHDMGFKVVVWDREHILADDEDDAITVANRVYDLQEYSEHHWRNILLANDVKDPFTLKRQFKGKRLKIPALIPSAAIQEFVRDWVEKTNAAMR